MRRAPAGGADAWRRAESVRDKMTQGAWFYAEAGGTPSGPYTTGEMEAILRKGQLNPETLIWRPGLAGWLPLKDIVEEILNDKACGKPQHTPVPVLLPESKIYRFDASHWNSARRTRRGVGHVVDLLLIFLLTFVLGIVAGITIGPRVFEHPSLIFLFAYFTYIYLSAYFTYYVALEGSCGRTVGKILVRTRVVREGNRPLKVWRALGRTLVRLVPFEEFSIINWSRRMWHDEWTKTVVIETGPISPMRKVGIAIVMLGTLALIWQCCESIG